MTKDDLFQVRIEEFSSRFKDHSFDDYLIKLLYEDLSYLEIEQLDKVLAHYFKEINTNYFLPSHKTLVKLAELLYKRPQKPKQEIKDCDYCFNKGVIRARSRTIPGQYARFKCHCFYGQYHKDLSGWTKDLQKDFETEKEYYDKRPDLNVKEVTQKAIEKLSGKGVRGKPIGKLEPLGNCLQSALNQKVKVEEMEKLGKEKIN